MHDLVHAAARALSANDAEALEQLAAEVRDRVDTFGMNLGEVARATAVLSAQVEAASAHIAMRSRIREAVESYRGDAWAR